MFSAQDLRQIQSNGTNEATINKQIVYFEKGFPYLAIKKAAAIGEGIISFSDSEKEKSLKEYIQTVSDKKIVKFVPASGAASRMFKDLFSFADKTYPTTEEQEEALSKNKAVTYFFEHIKKFSFYSDLDEHFEKEGGIAGLMAKKQYNKILNGLLNESGLNYGGLPKGLLNFHSYGSQGRTPAEEHLVEGAMYASNEGESHIHFTVSPEHRLKFVELMEKIDEKYAKKFGIKYKISFSEQKKSTDTIAVDLQNMPFREPDGTLLFRPAGHGALLSNLNDIDADLIYIKNIDNVVPDHLKQETIDSKKLLASAIIGVQDKIFTYLKSLEGDVSEEITQEIEAFLETTLCVLPSQGYKNSSAQDKKKYLISKLNRPLRICGMVKNEGEPGGGPFWAENEDKTISLQIVETAQIDPNSESDLAILKNSTHFNPVDLLCAVKNYKAKKFNLMEFTDPNTGFITQKSKDGKDLKAQELPGLWNGAMSDWNTLFCEVPLITFNPVKTVNDLLRKEHQPE